MQRPSLASMSEPQRPATCPSWMSNSKRCSGSGWRSARPSVICSDFSSLLLSRRVPRRFLPPGPPLGLPSARDIPVAGPVGPPPPPPIPIKFIGLAGAPGPEGQVVFFSDGRGHVFFGKEGDIIEGRYRVLKVSPGSAELAYLDGRGRQTILLSGQ